MTITHRDSRGRYISHSFARAIAIARQTHADARRRAEAFAAMLDHPVHVSPDGVRASQHYQFCTNAGDFINVSLTSSRVWFARSPEVAAEIPAQA